MKRIKAVLLILFMILPIFLNAKTYNEEVSTANSLLNRENYVNSYTKYIVNGNNIKFEFSENENKVNSSFTKGGFISIDEFNLTKKNNLSYLFDGVEFWTLSQSEDKVYAITYNDINTPKNKTASYRGKVTEFINPSVTVHGEGKINNPWSFDSVYKVSAKVDSKYATIISGNDTYVKGGCTSSECTASIKIEAKTGYRYITNDCNGLYDETNKVFTVNNIKRDTVCNVTFGKGIFVVTVPGGTPNKIYLKYGENYYKDFELTQIAKKLNSVTQRTGYIFSGYYYDSHKIINGEDEVNEENNLKIIYETVVNKYISRDVTLTYVYTPKQYTVSFDCNGGSNPPTTQVATYDESFTLTSDVCSRTGYTQTGWNTQPNGSGESWTVANKTNITWQIDQNVKLYAVWRANTYKIAYAGMSGATHGTNHPTTATYNAPIDISNPTRNGYKFTGWTFDGDTTTALHHNVDTHWTSNTELSQATRFYNLTPINNATVTMTANWTPNKMTITYYANGGVNQDGSTPSEPLATRVYNYDGDNFKTNGLPDFVGTNATWNLKKTGHKTSGKWIVDSPTGSVKIAYGPPYTTTQAAADAMGKLADFKAGDITVDLYAGWDLATYTITLNRQNGTGGTSSIYEKYSVGFFLDSAATSQKMTTSANPITNPTKTGNVFGGYYTSKNGGGTKIIEPTGYLVDGTSPSRYTAAGTLHAYWIPYKVKIQYNANGGHLASSHGSTISEDSSGFMLLNNSRIIHSIDYGTSSGSDGLANYNNSNYINITRTGYKVISGSEWKCLSDSNCVTENAVFSQAGAVAANSLCDASAGDCVVTLYVNWVSNIYKLTLNKNNGTGGTDYIYEKYGDGFYLDSDATNQKMTTSANPVEKPTRTGFTFLGYFSSSSNGTQFVAANGKIKDDANSSFYSSNATIYAQWAKNQYNISYNLDGGSHGGSNHPTSAYFNDPLDIDNPTKSGYSFDGWTFDGDTDTALHHDVNTHWTSHTEKSKATRFYNLASAASSTVTLTAHWTRLPYTITLNKQNGTGGTDSIYERYGDGFYLDSAATSQKMTTSANPITKPTRTGYTFGGYYTEISGGGTQLIDANGKILSNASSTQFNSNGTLYAYWTRNQYTISYALNGGSHGGSNHPTSALYNGALDIDNPTKSGYTFEGWTFDGDTATALHHDYQTHWTSHTEKSKETRFYNLASANGATVTMTAHWASNAYSITYEYNGGTAPSSGVPSSYTYGTGATINGRPTRNNYTFNGWSDNSSLTNAAFTKTISTTASGNKTFYAKWCRNCIVPSNGSCTLTATTAGTCTYTTRCNSGYTISGNGTYNPTCTANAVTWICTVRGNTVKVVPSGCNTSWTCSNEHPDGHPNGAYYHYCCQDTALANCSNGNCTGVTVDKSKCVKKSDYCNSGSSTVVSNDRVNSCYICPVSPYQAGNKYGYDTIWYVVNDSSW